MVPKPSQIKRQIKACLVIKGSFTNDINQWEGVLKVDFHINILVKLSQKVDVGWGQESEKQVVVNCEWSLNLHK